jgi:hypothetical protein
MTVQADRATPIGDVVATWPARGLVIVKREDGLLLGTWRPLRFQLIRRLIGAQRLVRYDLRTPEWTRLLALRALRDGDAYMAKTAEEE